MRNAALSENEKSFIMASVQGSLGYPLVAKQMRQISQPCGGAHKEDILSITTDDGGMDEEDLSYEAWVARIRRKRS